MRTGIPWSVKGIEPEAREAAKVAARREGKTLGQWLNETIIETASEDDGGHADGDDDLPALPVSATPGPTGNRMAAQALQIDFSPVTDALRDLVHRLERSERRSETALAGLDDTLADMAARLDRTERLSGALGGVLTGESGSGLDKTLGDLRARLEKSERGLERAELLNTDAMRTVERGLRAISTRLEEAERRADQAIKHAGTHTGEHADGSAESVRGLKASLDDLARRLDTAETAAQAARDQAAQAVSVLNTRGGANDDAVKALERAIGNVVDHIEASDSRTSKVIAALQTTVEGLASEMKALKAAGDSPAVGIEAIRSLEATMAALQQNIAEVTGRVGHVETAARRDVDQIATAIDDMGRRLERVREAAVETAVGAAVEAARKETGQAAQLVSGLEERLDSFGRRIDDTEKSSAEAIRTIESSVSDMAGRMREIAELGSSKAVFAEPLAAFERAIEDMGARLNSTDQRSAQALAKVEDISVELMRKLDAGSPAPEIAEVKAALDDMGTRLEMVEARDTSRGAPARDALQAPPLPEDDDDPFAPPPPPPLGHMPGQGQEARRDDDPFAADAPALGAPPFPGGFPDEAPFDAGDEAGNQTGAGPHARDDFLESARRAARASTGGDHDEAVRSPFAEPARRGIPQLGGTRKAPALIAAGLAVIAIAGLVVALLGSGPQEVAGPPEGIEIPGDGAPADLAALPDAPEAADTNDTGTGAEATAGPAQDTAVEASIEAPDAAQESGSESGPESGQAAADAATRAPAREIPEVVTPAQAARPDTASDRAGEGAGERAGGGTGAPVALTPRREIDVASLPDAAAKPASPAVPAAPARRTLREAAADGDPAAQYEIGQRYAAGSDGLPQDAEQAAFWLTRAAEQGLAPAQYRLGTLFEKGQGVPENPTRARSWYERAAQQGNVKALHNLAVMQAEGAGGAQDFAAAARSFEVAAKAGLADSQYNLAILYERGLGVERDLATAYRWFSIAGAGGDADAAARAEALKNSVDAAQLVDAELAARTFAPAASDAAANEVTWQAEAPEPGTVREVQRLLGSLGYDAGPADGILGGKTIDAVRQFERDRGLAVTGQVDARLVEALTQAAI